MRAGVLFLAMMAAAGCIRLVPRPDLEQPKAAVDRHALAGAVERGGEEAEPRDEKDVFVKGRDPSVFSFLSLTDLRDEHTVAWKWYDPSGRLYKETAPVTVGLSGRVFARYAAWDEIRIFEAQDEGRWTVAVFLDGAVALTSRFEVKSKL
ncbi:MAG: hypothetical protein FJY80_02865 [Candidatus Aminicenantes bacterium]|nr:hypothetical protein [Candidatus Aminicenantes bacterium]